MAHRPPAALHPLGAAALLHVPAADLAGRTVPLADVLGRDAGELMERAGAATSWRSRFGVVDDMLLRRLDASRLPEVGPVVAAWRAITASGGRMRVGALADEVGWSRRHLLARFRATTGLTPKEALRVARFEAVRAALVAPSPRRRGLADLATRHGFADQQHLAREWRAVWPSVGFVDADAGVRLLTEILGFTVTALHRDADGLVPHAEARWPDGGGVMFGSRGRPGAWGQLGPQGVYVVAAQPGTVDAIGARAQASEDVEVVGSPHDTDYGSHQIELRDRDGNLWTVGTYRGA